MKNGNNKIQVSIVDKLELKVGISFVEKVTICEKTVHLYFDKNKEGNSYKVYIISEKMYGNVLSGKVFLENPEEYIGDMPKDINEVEWIYSIQKKRKVFGDIKKTEGGLGYKVLIGITLIGIILLSVGIWKIEYKKVLMEKEETTIGTVYDYSTARLRGKRYTEGYYNIHVEYTVDGKIYKGYYGQTANKPSEGMTVMVYYAPDKPSKIINYDELMEFTIQFIIMGTSLAVVGGTLLISNIITFRKKKNKT